MTGLKTKTYFPSLYGMRAVAAFLVLFTHVERYKQTRSGSSIVGVAYNSFLGGLAVTFFFVLSGFLITHLLLSEKSDTGKLEIKKFLLKRSLRIWPLYYIVLLAGYFISIVVLKDTGTNLWDNGFILNSLLLPNIAFALNMIPDILVQIWSIGTEEQFYFVWPFIINRSSVKNLVIIFISIIAIWLLARGLLFLMNENRSVINVILFRTRIDCMAVGGLLSLFVFYKDRLPDVYNKAMKWISHPLADWITGLVFLFCLFLSWRFSLSIYQVYAGLFALILFRMIHRPSRLLESRPVKYLGRISYGIYLLHHFWVYFVFWLFSSGKKTGLEQSPLGDLQAFVLTGILTVASAMLSYQLIEKQFLKIKQRI